MSKPQEPEKPTGWNGKVKGYPPTIYWWLSLIRASLNEMADNIIEDDDDEGD